MKLASEAELLARAVSVVDPDQWVQTQKAFAALIEACATAEVQRIIFLDAPRVMGPEAWRAIEMQYGFGAMANALSALAADLVGLLLQSLRIAA